MNTNLFNFTLQIMMIAGILSIVALLVMPAIPLFSSKIHQASKQYVLVVDGSLTNNLPLAIARANKLSATIPGVVIEVIAVKKGVRLFLDETPFISDIKSLMAKGVTFSVCQNSLEQLTEKKRRPVNVMAGVRFIQDGHLYAESLKNNGYIDELA